MGLPGRAVILSDRTELIERARDGDRSAFGVLVTTSIARLDAAARLIVRDPDLAKDAVQEALIGAWRDLPSGSGPSLRRLTTEARPGIDSA